jgi:DHA1 family multidrug resistance protein-like MFS transporter
VRLLRDLPREVAVLGAVAFAVAVGFGVVAPALPVFATQFGVGKTAAGAVISAFAFMRLASALAGGRLVDRIGERIVLATGIGIVALSSALCGLAQTYTQLLLLRGVGGIGSAMFTVSAVSLLFRVVGPDQRARANSVFQGGFLIGGITGPAFGGVLADVSLRAPFFVYAGTLAAAGAIAMVFLTHSELHEKAGGAPRAERVKLPAALRNASYRTALVTNLGAGWTLFGIRSSLVPLFVIEGLNRSATWTGIGLLVTAAVQGGLLLPAGKLADTRGRRPALVLGTAAAAASMILIAVSTSVVVYVLAMAVFGVGGAFLGTTSAAVVADVAGGGGGTVVAAYQMASDVGAIAGPLLAGYLADEYSYGAAFGASAGVLLVGTAMALVMPETRPPTRKASPRSAAEG